MAWLLDTNACIGYLNGRSPQVRSRFNATDPAEIYVCCVVRAELCFGAALARDSDKTRTLQAQFLNRFRSLPFDDVAADTYGVIRTDLTRRGLIIGPNDLLIAAIAIAHRLTLVTHNVAEFGRVSELAIDDWES